MQAFAQFVIAKRAWIVATIAILTAFMTFLTAKVETDNSIDAWFDGGDPAYVQYKKFLKDFGSDEFFVIVLRSDRIFRRETLKKIARVTRRLEGERAFDRVVSLTNVDEIRSTTDGVEIAPLMRVIPSTSAALESVEERALGNSLYRGNIVSPDGSCAAIIATIENNDIPAKRRMVATVNRIVEEELGGDVEYYVAGTPVMDEEFDRLSRADKRRFGPLTVVLVVVLLYAAFRSIPSSVLPLLAVQVAVTWTVGYFYLWGNKLNMVLVVLSPILLVVGVGDSVHIIAQYHEESLKTKDKRRSIVDTIAHIGVPCLFTTLTTMVGFGSFVVSKIVPVRQLGVYAALGIGVAFIASITIIPIAQLYLSRPHWRTAGRLQSGVMARGLEALARFNQRHTWLILGFAVGLFGTSILGILRLKVETNNMEYLREGNALRRAYSFIEDALGGVTSFEVVVEGKEGSLREPEALRKIAGLQELMQSFPEVTKVTSLVDYVRETNRALHGEDARFGEIPTRRAGVAQSLLVLEMSATEELGRLVNWDYSRGRVSARLKFPPSERAKKLLASVNDHLEREFSGQLSAHTTGIIPLIVEWDAYLLRSQVQSFSIALVVIFIMMIVLLRSARYALVSMIPNVIPIMLTLAIMGFAGIRLDTATIMIASIAIGIAVDDTIHYVCRFRRELCRDGDYAGAMERTHRSVGRAIVFTSILLFCGFFVLVFSSFVPTAYFGLLTGITMVSALVGDLAILPVCLVVFKPGLSGAEERGMWGREQALEGENRGFGNVS